MSIGTKPEYSAVTGAVTDLAVDVLFVPVFGRDDALSGLEWLTGDDASEINRARTSGEFAARLFDVFTATVPGVTKSRRIALVGAGAPGEATAERLRRIGATCGYQARKFRAETAAILIRQELDATLAAQHLTDGFVTTEFDGATYRNDGSSPAVLSQVTICASGADAAALAAAVDRGRIIGDSANIARALANEPANILFPSELAHRVADTCGQVGLDIEILDENKLKELRMALLLGVGQGSERPPRLVVIRHNPPGAPASPVVGLIGKGVTFDTGGVSIKPADGMERMKSDMSGAAAVAAAMRAIALLKGPVRTIGIIPSAENMVGGRAIRPGDVLRGASGKTVEVINTDAEGRLILGDALWYAQQLGCTHLVDVATLTGAIAIALGRQVSGVFGQPAEWVEFVRARGAAAGDRLWPMPIYEEAIDQLHSEIADLINSAGRPGGAVTAAAFLREFAGGLPWAHLDIAGTAWAESKEPYQPKGATGVAVRTLIDVAMTGAGSRL